MIYVAIKAKFINIYIYNTNILFSYLMLDIVKVFYCYSIEKISTRSVKYIGKKANVHIFVFEDMFFSYNSFV